MAAGPSQSADDELFVLVLDPLANGPSSVAGLYSDLVYVAGIDARELPEQLRDRVERLERRGWVRARLQDQVGCLAPASDAERQRCWQQYARWLPTATREELAIDEIGLWYGMTDDGRDAWRHWAGEHDDALWELDDDLEGRIVAVVARSEELAHRRLAEWLAARGHVATGLRETTPVRDVHLRSGRVLAQGVRASCRYALLDAPR